jgi:hypothetical protein
MELKSGSEEGSYRSLFRHVCYTELGRFRDHSSDQEILEDIPLTAPYLLGY